VRRYSIFNRWLTWNAGWDDKPFNLTIERVKRDLIREQLTDRVTVAELLASLAAQVQALPLPQLEDF
jgi:hypothetical protein